ncbi:WxL domain-containing protein [Enterococcus mundtii]|uniref:WxL domain-containing protein n=1 Tax=Enterococcus mundtii TaxID=53346 RepID=UPI000825953C|nr:WxL domain-containing protein [Enterococcus mundtii]
MKKFLLASVLSTLFIALSCQMVYAEQHDDIGGYDAVKFRSSKEPTLPVDPTNPEIPVDPMNPDGSRPEPGTGGALSIDFASSLDFGINKISNKDEYYAAQAQRYFNDPSLITPNFVQVTDNRGTLAGWTLKVKETHQFRAEESTQYKELTGATLFFLKPKLVSNSNSPQPTAYEVLGMIPNQESMITSAEIDKGAGTWITRWGDRSDLFEKKEIIEGEEVNTTFTSAIQLFVPGATPKDPVSYQTNLVWILSDLPTNK